MLHPKLNILSRFLDNCLSESQSNALVSHVEKCERCAKKFNLFRNIEKVVSLRRNLTGSFTENVIANLGEVKGINQPTVGKITGINGTVVVYGNSDKEAIDGFIGMGLKKSDRLRVLGNSVVLIELNDGSSLYLNKETEIQFSFGKYTLSLPMGELFAMMKPQKKAFEIRTPAAVLGVVGTDFDAQITKKNNTILKVLKGKVSFKNDSGSVIVKSKHEVAASQYTKPKPAKVKDAKTISTWISPIKPKTSRRGRIMKNVGFLILLLAIVIGGIFYLQKRLGHQRVVPTHQTALKELQPKEAKPKAMAENEILQVFRTIQQDMREKNYERIGKYGTSTFLSWRNAATVKEYLERALNDNILGPEDYVLKGAPTKFISTGNSVTLVLSEPWHNTTCNLVFTKIGDKWVVSDINNMQGYGQSIDATAKEEIPEAQDTRGMSAEQVIRAFYQAMIANDADKAIGYLTLPDNKAKLQYRNGIRMVLQEAGITEIRQIKVSGESAFAVFSVTGSFPGLGVARRPDERQSKLYLSNTPTGLKIDMSRSSIFGDRPEDYK